MNSLFRIVPRKVDIHGRPSKYGVWIFDDEKRGLIAEPFVQDAGEILDALSAHLPHAEEGICILFAAEFFPTSTVELTREERSGGGFFYQMANGMRGWLCPAVEKYFGTHPEKIFLQVI